MTEPSEAAWNKAQAFVAGDNPADWQRNVARFIQEVSDAARAVYASLGDEGWGDVRSLLAPFILEEPVDPLVEVLEESWRAPGTMTKNQFAQYVRELLAKRGGRIVFGDEG